MALRKRSQKLVRNASDSQLSLPPHYPAHRMLRNSAALILYRSWCRHCVEGRGREQGHVATDQSARKIAIVGFDYMFVGKRRTYEREEELEEDDKADGVLKVIVVRCFKSKALFAHAVPAKGVDEAGYVVDCIVQDVLWLGYSKVI